LSSALHTPSSGCGGGGGVRRRQRVIEGRVKVIEDNEKKTEEE
jgi:hypothetical protein